ncbi:PREDICTED: ataxin-10 [Ceratosolen solmsi marchali]|uniref:Ataxin-10 n=1 Tax=Ceratosolen solmsi marchali TaxID=326594 RepID=A0AAJ7DWG2_9HYME|nr:PREDICTED: ataxin-10 [Ceratosolen solmsi marchali]
MEPNKMLISCIEDKDWDVLMTILKPKDFLVVVPRTMSDFIKVLRVAELLVNEDLQLPEELINILLKCLANSCVHSFYQKTYTPEGDISSYKNIYKFLFEEVSRLNEHIPYPCLTCFPYDSIVRWVVKIIIELSEAKKKLNDNQNDVLRLSLQFLCNFFTFSCKNSSAVDSVIKCIKLVGDDRAPIARVACAYVHNMVKQHLQQFYTTIDKKQLTTELIKSTIADIRAALDALSLLVNEPHYLKEVYNEISIDDKLYLLDIIFQTVHSGPCNEGIENPTGLQIEVIEFLCDIFKKKSDAIFKSVDTEMSDLDITEITMLLDIIGIITSKSNKEQCKSLQDDTSFLINCLFLLKAVHLYGKQSNNHFTPIQKLNDLTLNTQNNCCNEAEDPNNHVCFKSIEAHPAYRFKARLIRVIGNLVYKHKKNQNLIRENDGIPLLLDCCNIDARNPMITQWAILAIRNLLEDNPENQEVVHKSVKVGVFENSVVRTLGLTLHGEGEENTIGIMPLPSKNN